MAQLIGAPSAAPESQCHVCGNKLGDPSAPPKIRLQEWQALIRGEQPEPHPSAASLQRLMQSLCAKGWYEVARALLNEELCQFCRVPLAAAANFSDMAHALAQQACAADPDNNAARQILDDLGSREPAEPFQARQSDYFIAAIEPPMSQADLDLQS